MSTGVLNNMAYSKTLEIIAEDVTEQQELMYLYLIESGVINLSVLTDHQLLKIQNPKWRLKFIEDFVNNYIYAKALWRYTDVHPYDSYLEPIYNDYIASEFVEIPLDISKLHDVFSSMERDIINALPEVICKLTWNVWSVTIVAQSLIYRNEGDFRIISFAKDVLENKENPMHGKISKETLLKHERP